jgi:hypothetical protein
MAQHDPRLGGLSLIGPGRAGRHQITVHDLPRQDPGTNLQVSRVKHPELFRTDLIPATRGDRSWLGGTPGPATAHDGTAAVRSLLLPHKRLVPQLLSRPQPLRLPAIKDRLHDVWRETGERQT